MVWVRRGTGANMFRVGSAELPPLWAGRLGPGVAARGAVGALLTVAFLFAAGDALLCGSLRCRCQTCRSWHWPIITLLHPSGRHSGEDWG